MNNNLTLALGAAFLQGATATFTEMKSSTTYGYQFEIAPSATDADYVEITIRCSPTSWVGIVLGDAAMATNADMIVVDCVNQTVVDTQSSGYQQPTVTDTTSNLTTVWSTYLSGYEALITRQLDTGDSNDYAIQPDTSFQVGWALRYTDGTLSSKHEVAGSNALTITTSATTTDPVVDVPDAASNIILTSAAVALASIATLMF